MLTDQELQSLSNMGNEAEEAAGEIQRLRAELGEALAELPQAVRRERNRCAALVEAMARSMPEGSATRDAAVTVAAQIRSGA